MEVERYTIANGESIFVGLSRKFGTISPLWFVISTLLPWIWPGIIASSATVFARALGLRYSGMYGVALLLLIGLLLSFGHVIYKTQEKVQKTIIIIGVPFIFLIALYLSRSSDWIALVGGLFGKGDGYFLLPKAIPFATFLGALAYAGAGGNLNLAQSLYAKEKGYGMGKYSGRITNILRGKEEEVSLEGSTFEPTPENVKSFNIWWKRLNIEHGLVFWATGAVTMLMLSLLAFSSVYGLEGIETGINFVIFESQVISQNTFNFLGTFFLLMVGVMLFGTQFSVFGSTSRMLAENLVILSPDRFKIKRIPRYFFIFLWMQILSGVLIFLIGFDEPLGLVVTGAVLNAISMFIYTGFIIILNNSLLHRSIRPSVVRNLILVFAFLFYGGFSSYTVYINIFR